MKTTFILVLLIILGHFGQASNNSTDRKDFQKRTFKELSELLKSESQAGSQKEEKRGKILFRSDGSSAESVESENKPGHVEFVVLEIPTGTSCETMKELCVERGGHCTDDGEKCCEIDACFVCFDGWTGPNCDIPEESNEKPDSDSSDSSDSSEFCRPTNPCKNGGICNGVDGSCHCINGWTGSNCQTPKESKICQPNPCKNGGICNGMDGSCYCMNGWTGSHCQTQQESKGFCTPNPCKNGGVCDGNAKSCYCTDGWTGATCQTPEGQSETPDVASRGVACNPNPCMNGGVCNGRNGTCHCINNYTGDQCETEIH